MSQYMDEKEAALWPRLYHRLDSLDDESLKPASWTANLPDFPEWKHEIKENKCYSHAPVIQVKRMPSP